MSALPIHGALRDKPRLRPAPEGTAASPLPGVALRGAVLADVPALEQLMAPYVATGDLLPRSNYDLCRHIKEYVIAEGPTGEVIGCGSLKVYSRDLAELLALTRKPAFFLKVGFAPAEREHFPLKVWADCTRCPRQNCCDEVAVVLRL